MTTVPEVATDAQLRNYVDQERRRAATTIASHLEETAAVIMLALKEAKTKEESLSAEKRALGFGIMVDKLNVLTGREPTPRYGTSPGAWLDGLPPPDELAHTAQLPPLEHAANGQSGHPPTSGDMSRRRR